MSVNKVILIGRLGQDPETRVLQSGKTVSSFSLATGKKWKDDAGSVNESTEWHSIELWDKLSEVASTYLKKGSEVYLEGELKTESWDTENGKRYRTKIVGKSLQMIGGKPAEGGGSERRSPATATNPPDDDLPF